MKMSLGLMNKSKVEKTCLIFSNGNLLNSARREFTVSAKNITKRTKSSSSSFFFPAFTHIIYNRITISSIYTSMDSRGHAEGHSSFLKKPLCRHYSKAVRKRGKYAKRGLKEGLKEAKKKKRKIQPSEYTSQKSLSVRYETPAI